QTVLQSVMKLSDRRALVQVVDHDFVRRQQSRVQLLFFGVIGPHGCNECSRGHIFLLKKVAGWTRRGDAKAAASDRPSQVSDGVYLDSQLGRELLGKTLGYCRIGIKGIYGLDGPNSSKCPERDSTLVPASADGRCPGIRASEVLSRDRRRCSSAEDCDFNGVHHGQCIAILAVTKHYDPQDVWHPEPLRVLKKIRIHFGCKIGFAPVKHRGFNMEPSISGMYPHDSWRRRFAFGVLLECLFDRRNALVDAEQRGDLLTAEQQSPNTFHDSLRTLKRQR